MAAIDITAGGLDRPEAGARRSLIPYIALGAFPAVIWAFSIAMTAQRHNVAYDFHHFFYPHARDVLSGKAPPGAYPALTSLLYAPFALLPRNVADVVVTLALVGCVAGILRALDVRDWRCYGAVALWVPVFSGVWVANVTLPLTLAVALLWRWRDRQVVAGLLAAFVVALKLFLWPLAVWLAATRRWRSLAIAAGLGVAVSLAAWAVVGFDALERFPGALQRMVDLDGGRAYTISALLRDAGTPEAAAYGVSTVVGVAVLVAAVIAARRGFEQRGFALAVVAALLLSPIVWTDYPVLLIVPIAIVRPRFSPLWLAPLPIWLCPHVNGAPWQKAVLLATLALTAVALVRAAGAREPRPALQ